MKSAPAPEIAVRRDRFAPFDLAAAEARRDWRDALAWPLDVGSVRSAMERHYRTALAFAAALEPQSQRIVVLALGRIVSNVSALLECALVVQAERRAGFAVHGGPPELDWLRGEGTVAPMTPQRAGQPQRRMAVPAVRRLARTASWTKWWRMPAAMLAPDAVCVSHNAMLREAARGARVRFVHGDRVLDRARRRASRIRDVHDVRDIAAAMTRVFTQGFEDGMAGRLAAIVGPKVAGNLETAAADLAALASLRRLPADLWSGSAGSYAPRALGLEVMRRGGAVVRFDHGGAAGMIANPDAFTVREICASTRFVAATERVAELCRGLDATNPIPELPRAEIVGGAGEPHVRQAFALPPAPRRTRPRVVYASGAIYGFRQIFPPVPRDAVYLDWQMRLAETLLSLPADVLLKPHPEGIFRGRPHPLAALGCSTNARFESTMAAADVFVFDFPLSTAFWTALCSDRPVVFVDLGLAPFHPEVRRMVEARCRIVPAPWNVDNLPQIDRAALEAAVFARDAPDPAPFRRLLAGAP